MRPGRCRLLRLHHRVGRGRAPAVVGSPRSGSSRSVSSSRSATPWRRGSSAPTLEAASWRRRGRRPRCRSPRVGSGWVLVGVVMGSLLADEDLAEADVGVDDDVGRALAEGLDGADVAAVAPVEVDGVAGRPRSGRSTSVPGRGSTCEMSPAPTELCTSTVRLSGMQICSSPMPTRASTRRGGAGVVGSLGEVELGGADAQPVLRARCRWPTGARCARRCLHRGSRRGRRRRSRWPARAPRRGSR